MRERVRRGYEEGDYESEYRQDREIREKEKDLLSKMLDQMEGQKVLDLGCGTGIPFDRYLANHGSAVLGVDVAESHVEQARKNVPDAEFQRADFLELKLPNEEFDAVVSFYAIFHIPREKHGKLLSKAHNWLKPGGILLITMGGTEMTEYEGEIGGEDMVWSSYHPEESKEIVENAGFRIQESYIEDWRDETHLWILAKKL